MTNYLFDSIVFGKALYTIILNTYEQIKEIGNNRAVQRINFSDACERNKNN